MQNPKTFFEKWLSDTLENDPQYAVNIVCNYYDYCDPCPLSEDGRPCYDSGDALAKLNSIVEGDIEYDN